MRCLGRFVGKNKEPVEYVFLCKRQRSISLLKKRLHATRHIDSGHAKQMPEDEGGVDDEESGPEEDGKDECAFLF